MSTGIQWTDETWNPTVGCTRVSAGCDHCYAFQVHDQRHVAWKRGRWDDAPSQYHQPFSRVQMIGDRLEKPLHWKKPRRIFVNSMSDLFHEDVPDEFIDRVFAAMALTPQHTYQVLTKRPERMREYLGAENRANKILWAGQDSDLSRAAGKELKGLFYFGDDDQVELLWPLPNVWMGTSVEDQAAADERIPHLLATPAAVRFLSCEPLLGPLNITGDPDGLVWPWAEARAEGHGIDWVIVGGESGPHARPCNVEWIRDIVGQCQAANVPVFVKQLGSKPYDEMHQLRRVGFGAPVGLIAASEPVQVPHRLRSRHGSDPEEWPEDLRVTQFPEVAS